MKIKTKAILIFILFTALIMTPFSIFIMNRIEKEALKSILTEHTTNTRIFSRSVLNTLMMNGGNIRAASVDIKDMLLMLEPLKENGLVYADAVLLSSNQNLNGTILGSIDTDKKFTEFRKYSGKLSEAELIQILNRKTDFREFSVDEPYFEFISFGSLPGKPPFCFARTVVRKSVALKSAEELKNYVNTANFITIGTVLFLAVILGGYITRPVTALTDGAKEIESGNYSYRVNVKSRDEIGTLASTFNNMSSMIDAKIHELETANVELKKMDRLKDEFLANTSHELRTPIHGIMGLTESLLDGVCGEQNSNTRHILEMVSKSSRRLSNLVNDILDYSRLKHSDIRLEPVTVDMGTMADTAAMILSTLASEKHLGIVNRIPPGTVFVQADENRLHQIMMNLLGNAVKFTEQGQIEISSVKSGDRHIISVKDTGIGIPKEKQEIIFSSFVQSDGSISRKYGGTGLGLAITKDFVELHGGTIGVESEPGSGSRFFFDLPEAKGAARKEDIAMAGGKSGETIVPLMPAEIPDIAGEEELSGASILVIDDDPVNLQILINQLTLEKYRVVSASDGKEALGHIMGSEEFDLVLLDVMMPELSGFEVCRRIREKYTSHELPVIMLTAKDTSEDVLTGLSLGANDYITKPFDKKQILVRIKNYISLRRAVKEENRFIALKQELEIAKNIQLATLPQSVPDIKHLNINARYEPMMQIGGDFYDFYILDENRIGILIADVTGHGVPAALISSMIKIAFRMSHEYMENPDTLLKKISTALFAHTSGRFITAFYLFIDMEKMEVSFSNAGHWPVYLIKKEKQLLQELTVKGTLIGISPEQKFFSSSIKIERGDRLVMYTDGLIEERNSEGEILGEESFRELILRHSPLGSGPLIDDVFSRLEEWSGIGENGKSGLEDDATLIVIDLENPEDIT